MKWNDFFYFSKGERNALSLLVGLITTAWIVLMLTDFRAEPDIQHEDSLTDKTIITPSYQTDTTTITDIPEKEFSSKKKEILTLKDPKRHFKQNKSSYPQTKKYPLGTVIELNSADTIMLQMIPGIGTTFSNRIVKYRNLLGGFYTLTQLKEVYGIDEEKYEALKNWFTVDLNLINKLQVNQLSAEVLSKHPYISYKQANTLYRLRKQKGKLISWDNLYLLEEFPEEDIQRLAPYLSFD